MWRKFLASQGLAAMVAALFTLSTALAEEPPAKETTAKETTAKEAEKAKPAAPIKAKPLSDTVKKGLEYLAGQQHSDGGWGQGGGWRTASQGGRVEGAEVQDPSDVGNTCAAMLALLRAGNTPSQGPYAKQMQRGLDFVMGHIEGSDKDSLYVTSVRNTQLQSKIGSYVDTFLAGLLLAELKGTLQDKKTEDRLAAALDKTIGKIEKNQQADGLFAGNAGWASVLSQGICGKAINRAAQKGVAVRAETLERDYKQALASLDASKAMPGGIGGGVVASRSGAAPAARSRTDLLAAAPPVAGPVPASAALPAGAAEAARTSRPVAAERLADAAAAPTPAKSFAEGGVRLSGLSDAGIAIYNFSANTSRVQELVNTNASVEKNARQVLADKEASDEQKEEARESLRRVEQVAQTQKQAVDDIVRRLDDERFIKGFGNNGGEEFLSYMNISETLVIKGDADWQRWDKVISDSLARVQNQDGSWSGQHCITGRTFCTATALLTMLADRMPLPSDEAKQGK